MEAENVQGGIVTVLLEVVNSYQMTVEVQLVVRDPSKKVFGVSSGQRKETKETWWWNEEVSKGRGWQIKSGTAKEMKKERRWKGL